MATTAKTDGEKLKAYLELNLINQSELARTLEIGRTTLYRMFDEQVISTGRKKQIADAFGVRMSDIWGGKVPADDFSANPKDFEQLKSLERVVSETLNRVDSVNAQLNDLEQRVRSLEADRLKKNGGKGLRFKK